MSSENEAQKKAIFDSMSPRGQARILKKGYDRWNPFEEPKDPIDIRKDATKRNSQMLMRDFLKSAGLTSYSSQYERGLAEMCLGIINREDRYLAMYDFACWYRRLLEEEGVELER
ncbi:MAG: hypothetical protein ACLFS7_10600 [Desulfosudaceae bacterium]